MVRTEFRTQRSRGQYGSAPGVVHSEYETGRMILAGAGSFTGSKIITTCAAVCSTEPRSTGWLSHSRCTGVFPGLLQCPAGLQQ